ncbi:MAG: helix-turn-helix transcriptional regulator [Bacilli bacterium]
MINSYKIGKYIQSQRKKIGLTQNKLSEILSISPQAISKWETGSTLPDTSILLNLAETLETTVDKILYGGNIVTKTHKKINIPNIIEGLQSIHSMKAYFGENSTFYQGAIQGINEKMNIDFEKYYQDEYSKEVLLSEVIIQYLMEGYSTSKLDVDTFIKTDKMRAIIYKYIGGENIMKQLFYGDDPKLFEKIRSLAKEFSNINVLNELPGEYLRLDAGKNYWATEIETDQDFCYGIAADENNIQVFTYGFGGSNMKQVIKVAR